MSVRWMRTAQIKGGKTMEAVAWSKELNAHMEKKHGLPKIHIWLDSFGTLNTVRWTIDVPDLATLEKAQTSIMSDPDYWKAVKKAVEQDLFFDGTIVDNIYREV